MMRRPASSAAPSNSTRGWKTRRWGLGWCTRSAATWTRRWHGTGAPLRSRPPCIQAHTNVCHLLLQTNQFEAAVAACRRGLRYRPADANLLAGLGHGLVGTGLRDQGLAVFRRSLALNGENATLRTYLARLETGQGEGAGPGEVVTLQ